jgi:hypothetical protein
VHYNNKKKKPNRVHCFMWLLLENVAQPQKTKTLGITFEQMPLHAEDQCLFFPHGTFHNPTAGQTMPIEESEKIHLEGTLYKGTLHLEGVRNLALLHLVIYLCLGS